MIMEITFLVVAYITCLIGVKFWEK